MELSDVKGWKVLSTGGALRAGALSLVGYQAERMVEGFYVDKVIVSCKGIDRNKGFTDSNELDAGLKRQMLLSADTKILAADSGKFGRVSFTKITDYADLDVIVTDYRMDEEWKELLKDCGVSIVDRKSVV